MEIFSPVTASLAAFRKSNKLNPGISWLLLYGDKKYSLLNTGSCVPFKRKIYLTVNGRILVCERIDYEFSVGYVTENGVELDTDKIAKKYNYYCKKLHHQCRSCYSQASCSQCAVDRKSVV